MQNGFFKECEYSGFCSPSPHSSLFTDPITLQSSAHMNQYGWCIDSIRPHFHYIQFAPNRFCYPLTIYVFALLMYTDSTHWPALLHLKHPLVNECCWTSFKFLENFVVVPGGKYIFNVCKLMCVSHVEFGDWFGFIRTWVLLPKF